MARKIDLWCGKQYVSSNYIPTKEWRKWMPPLIQIPLMEVGRDEENKEFRLNAMKTLV